ncbi:MAG: hypothetical protein JWP35_3134 [Caulobacter sp.]|nr:hypothetical protein [Caulobacter sp.]
MRDSVLRFAGRDDLSGGGLALLALLLMILASPAPAMAAERSLGKAEVMKMAGEHVILCEGWRDVDESCQSVLFLDTQDGQTLTETDRLQIADEPDVAVAIRNPVTLEGGAVCATVDFGPQHTVMLMDGEPSDNELAGHFLDALKVSLAAYDGRRACESFRRDDATGVIKSTTTIDGGAAPELDSIYRRLPAGARVRLRPLLESDSSEQSI